MTMFSGRLRGELNKYHHDEEFAFRVRSRSVKILAFEVAQSAGYSISESNRYAASCLNAGIEDNGRVSPVYRMIGHIGADAKDLDPVALERRLRAINSEVHQALMTE